MEHVFYYQYKQGDDNKVVYSKKQCTRPKVTKDYKHLDNMFNLGLIDVYGYYIEEAGESSLFKE